MKKNYLVTLYYHTSPRAVGAKQVRDLFKACDKWFIINNISENGTFRLILLKKMTEEIIDRGFVALDWENF